MENYGIDHLHKDDGVEEELSGMQEDNKDFGKTSLDNFLNEGSESRNQQQENGFCKQEHELEMNSVMSSISEVSRAKEILCTHSASSNRVLDQCIPAPVRGHRNGDGREVLFCRSMTEWRESPQNDLDGLSDDEKKRLIVNLVKIKNDGTIEVDLDKGAPVAPKLLEIRSFEGLPKNGIIVSDSNRLIPKLKIAILVVGTRGDVQPFLAIAKRLQEFGHCVRLATHANFRTFVQSAGVEFYPLGGDPWVLAGYMARNKGLIPSGPSEISVQRKQLLAIIESLLPACTEPDLESGEPFRAQAIIANPAAYGHSHVAEALNIPLHIFFTMPWTPTHEFPHPFARVLQSAGYWLSYVIVDLIIWWGIRGYINDFRKRKLNLPPISYFSMYHGSISHLPTGYMWSPHVVPKPSDWGPLVDVVGYCFLNLGSKYQPQDEFVQWIQKGSKPIYFGFGSMPLEDSKKTAEIILDALKQTGKRGIIDRGWGNLGHFVSLQDSSSIFLGAYVSMDQIRIFSEKMPCNWGTEYAMEVPDNVFLLEECPHDWLFPQCSAVVHHGGAGTTATGLRAACPTTIVPFFGDQFFWGYRIHQRGLGPAPISISELSVESLSNAIRFMLQQEVRSRAMEIANLIHNEDGVAAAVDSFHNHLPAELPLPAPSAKEDDHPNPLQSLVLQIGKLCCLPCGGL